MPLRTRTTHLSFLLLTTYSLALAQTFDPTKPTKDYIRLNGQVVAIENGVASLPIVLFSDSIITFAKRSIGTASASQALKITNGGTAPLAIASVALSGTNPGDFILSNGCGSTLAAGANCSVGIVFEPTAAGSRQAALVLTDDAAGSPQTVTLTGTGVNGTVTASASYVGTDTATQGTWTGVYGADGQLIANDLNNAPPYATVSLSGDSLYTWAASTTDVRALQTASGAPTRMASTYYSSTSFTINLNLTDGNTHKISLYLVDWDSTVRTETIAILDANSSALLDTESYSGYHNGEYAAWTVQGHVLIQVTKTAGSNGVVSGVFFDTPPPAAALTPAGLTFGNQGVGTASASQSVTLTNGSATTALTIGSVAITGTNAGDFSVADGCAASLDAGASCQLDVTFTPTAGGTRTAALTITDNAGHGASSAQGVSLTGMGVAPEPDAVVPATPLIFPLAAVGTSDPVQTVTLSNLGNAALAISSIAVTGANPGDFSASNNCGATLAIETSCTVTVTFTPAAAGARAAILTITDNTAGVAGSPQSVSLNGTGLGVAAAGVPPTLPFASQNVGVSASQGLTVTNTGTGTLTISALSLSGANAGDFAWSGCAGASLTPNTSCGLTVTFTPGAEGSRTATLTITDNAGNETGSTQAVQLSGTGLQPVVGISVTSVSFGNQAVGSVASSGFSITNTGNGTLTISAVAMTGPNAAYFASSGCAGASLGQNASCTINVTFAPATYGALAATLAITDNTANMAGSTQNVPLSGTGLEPVIAVSPPILNFGNQTISLASMGESVTVTNSGNEAASITSVGTGSSQFNVTNGCGSSLAPSSSCQLTVTFTPAGAGNQSATLSITDNSGNAASTQTVSLQGTGVIPAITVAPNPLDFGIVLVGQSSGFINAVVTNKGPGFLSLSVEITAGNSQDFSLETNGCYAWVSPGATCTISFQFTPTTVGIRTATASLSGNQVNSPYSLTLTGRGKDGTQ